MKFRRFLRDASLGGNPLEEETKLQFLQAALDEAGSIELQTRREKGPVRFQEFWNWCCARYGGDEQRESLEQLRRLKPRNEGRLTLPDWRDYTAKFRQIYERLDNPPYEEAWRLLMESIPQRLRDKVIRKVEDRKQNNTSLKINGLRGYEVE